MMMRYFFALWVICSVLCCMAEAYPSRLVLHRVQPDGRESLCTPVARYTDAAGRTVDLVGAVHLADARYYRNLNRAFVRYDKVLYEMVDGEGVPEMLRLSRKVAEGKSAASEQKRLVELMSAGQRRNRSTEALAQYYRVMAELLGLSLQTEQVDYGLEQMVFADMSSEEFQQAMTERGESWLTLACDALAEDLASQQGRVLSLPTLSRSALRREMVRALASASAGSRLQQRAIIVARNERCFTVLDRELAQAPTGSRLAVFYGAMHLADMHRRMLARGFTLQGVQWLTAIRA